jgi:excisionase family DNA binding protein
MSMGKKPLSVREVAGALGLSESTIRSWLAQRRLGFVRLGRAIRIPVEEVERVLAQGSVPAREVRDGR